MRQTPNILFIFSDQQHGGAMGRLDPFFRAPHLDAFAREAVRFERCFCTTPQCSPSRATLMTGLYPSRTGVLNNVGAVGGDPLRMPTLAPAMQQAGYATACFGKWHLGDDPIATAGWDQRQTFHTDGHLDDRAVSEHVSAWLRDRTGQGGRPWFLAASYNDPHGIYAFRHRRPQPDDAAVPLPQSWHEEDLSTKPAPQLRFMTHDQGRAIHGEPASAWRGYRATYRDHVADFDRHVGRLLAALDATGLAEATLVVIASDHGDMDAHHRLIFKGPFMYEQMVHVPLMIRLPRAWRQPARQDINELIVNTDICPTLLDFAGAAVPACDGQSLKARLLGEGAPSQRDFVVGQYHGKQQWCEPIRMIRTATHKLNIYAAGDMELYDLVTDAHELRNLAESPRHATVRRELASQLWGWIEANADPFANLEPHQPAT